MILALLAAASMQAAPRLPVYNVQKVPPAPMPTIAEAARAPLNDGSGTEIALLVGADSAVIVARGGRWNGQGAPLTSPDIVLMLLADPRMAPLWPALTDWAGPGLEKLRYQRLELARRMAASGGTMMANTTAASSTRPQTRAVMALSEGQAAAGDVDAALATIATARAASQAKSDWEQAEYMALSVRTATLTRARDGTPAALAVLDEAEARLGRGNAYSINFQINRAAYLVEEKRPAEALAALDLAEAPFQARGKGRAGAGGEAVPGSGRQFAWIRICALTQLGRAAEAAPLMTAMYPRREPTDESFRVPGSETIRFRLFRCTGDAAAAAHELAEELAKAPLGGLAMLYLQPAFAQPNYDPAFLRRVAAEPEMVRALKGRFRALPSALTPALNHWRDSR